MNLLLQDQVHAQTLRRRNNFIISLVKYQLDLLHQDQNHRTQSED
jgi:hypothetical protein